MLIYMLYSGDLRESLRCPCNLAFAHEHTEGVRAGAQIWGQNYAFFLEYANKVYFILLFLHKKGGPQPQSALKTHSRKVNLRGN